LRCPTLLTLRRGSPLVVLIVSSSFVALTDCRRVSLHPMCCAQFLSGILKRSFPIVNLHLLVAVSFADFVCLCKRSLSQFMRPRNFVFHHICSPFFLSLCRFVANPTQSKANEHSPTVLKDIVIGVLHCAAYLFIRNPVHVSDSRVA